MRNIQRRHLLIATAALLASPFALAQTRARPSIVGVLWQYRRIAPEAWPKGPIATQLRELGWVEGKNLLVVHADAENRPERLAELAAELVGKRVDVILTGGPAPAVAAARATKAIPIVFYSVHFPIEMGLVRSLARPGGNVTGVAYLAGDDVQVAKPAEFLKTIAPSAKRLAWIRNPSNVTTVAGGTVSFPDSAKALSQLGFDRHVHYVERTEDLEPAFAAILNSGAQAIYIPATPFGVANRQRIVDFANRHRLPTVSDGDQIVDAGGLVSYGPNIPEIRRMGVAYVDRILRGTPPADLPVALPSKFDLVVNLKTAKALGITVPHSVLVRADRVIE
jgi:putative ABC transport system substrate-binding protein